MLKVRNRRLDPEEQIAILEDAAVPAFSEHLDHAGCGALRAGDVRVLQINVGKLCNQRCHHCHVDAGPDRTDELMSRATFDAVLRAVEALRPEVVDITGGAPELNPHFRDFVTEARSLGVGEVIDRCNLTVLLIASQSDLAEFLAHHDVHVVASLPAISSSQTDAQRGEGVFDSSVRALRLLNELGYGKGGSRKLTLMSNPSGAFFPPPQEATERRFRKILADRFGIVFDDLVQLNNMPISRFLEWLVDREGFDPYLEKLSRAFNPGAVGGLMCRDTLSVAWDGTLHDCDFNQMLELPISAEGSRTIFDLDRDLLVGREIVTGRHCLGCTAGQGSSCGGATGGKG